MPIRKSHFTRREFAKIAGLTALAGIASTSSLIAFKKNKKYQFTGKIAGSNFKVGHLLREKIFYTPQRVEKINTVIVGGGISGLATAWSLKKNNMNDFILLEMDAVTGGNSQSGENSVSKFPWGAHYVPVPNMYDLNLREMFEDFNIITGYENNLPIINDYFLCADPQERLFYQGRWQDGLVPTNGISELDKSHYNSFFHFIESLKGKTGKDNKYIFSIPLDSSSQDEEYLNLDKISMLDFMLQNKWDSKPLNWYVNYCCRDDFGLGHDKVSAWAGLHYFCARIGKCANSVSAENITWPEGNGWLANKLKDYSQAHIKCNQLVYNIEVISPDKAYVDVLNPTTQQYIRYEAKNIVYCGPRFTAANIIKDLDSKIIKNLTYSPWLTANITLSNRPGGKGEPLSWDNVSYYSNSLGYIVATHQNLKFNQNETVITYYLPLDKLESKESRHSAFKKSFDEWVEILLPDLEKFHSGITENITNLDVWIWGHGMISPGIDFLWSKDRQEMKKNQGPIQFAHTDISGISIFEEALHQGCRAAKKILKEKGT